jgi:histidyl-tRNA synthetase
MNSDVAKAKKSYPESRAMSGFMELLPEDQIEFDRLKDLILATYESFGFTALDTPVMERLEVLRAKKVGETENSTLIYEIGREDGPNEAGLRFDLTVPLARYVANHYNELSFPFRRAHVAKVYRAERSQKGRFREFCQCDIDVIGHESLSIRYDAEIPSIIYQLFKKLDFGKFTIRINNRKLMNGLVESLGCAATAEEVLAVIDRKGKMAAADFGEQLAKLGLDQKMVEFVDGFCGITGRNAEVLNKLKGLGIDNESFVTGLNELETVADFMSTLGIDEAYYQIDPTVVRGLDYYTSTVYETVLDDYPQIGSVCGGGRYDNLAEAYTKEKLPGVGISIGLTRLFDRLKDEGLIKAGNKTVADIIVVPREDENIASALQVGQQLRAAGFKVDVLLESQSYKKKMNYVIRKDTRYTVIIGEDEEKSGTVALQYKGAGEAVVKEVVARDSIATRIKGVLGS